MAKNLVNEIFGRLKVIAAAPPIPNKSGAGARAAWLCECECKAQKIVKEQYLLCGDTKSCGCLNNEKRSERSGKMLDAWKNPNRIEANAKRAYHGRYDNDGDTITFQKFLEISQLKCFYCAATPSNIAKDADNSSGNEFIYNGLDRVLSKTANGEKLGHTEDNCVPCCKICNWAKMDRTQEEFFSWVELVYNKMFARGD